MVDRKPPRIDGDERATLGALLRYQRESLVRKVADVSDADARRPMVPTGTSLLWLVKHMARAEVVWVQIRFAGRDLPVPDDTVRPDDTLADAVAVYEATWPVTDALAAAADLTTPCARPDAGPPVTLRWVLAHLLEETARHAGHADICRELIDGAVGR
jgi:uncharacterized damage-inducible protein DinB